MIPALIPLALLLAASSLSAEPFITFSKPWLLRPGHATDDRLDHPSGSPQALIFPSYAAIDPDNPTAYRIHLSGVLIQRRKYPSFAQRLLLKGYRKLWRPRDDDEKDRLQIRMSYFFASTLGHSKHVASVSGLTVGGVQMPSMRVSKNGFFYTPEGDDSDALVSVDTPGFQSGDIATVKYRLPGASDVQFGRVHVWGPTGYIVVADIDDTIKVTHVVKYRKMFRKAFMENYKPVPGMPALFQHLRTWLATEDDSDSATDSTTAVGFVYTSGTPYPLLPSLDRFIKNASFPTGVIQLAKFRVKDPTTVIKLPQYVSFKVKHIRTLARDFPERKIVLFGDSGQRDAKAFAILMRSDPAGERYPCAFIRLVRGVDAAREAKLNTRKVFLNAFKGIPRKRWFLFEDPREVFNVEFDRNRCRPAGVPDSDIGGGL